MHETIEVPADMNESILLLEDGAKFTGYGFGIQKSVAGEVVFNTGMVGYPESLTDPSYRGQILVFTYPLIGNYGMPGLKRTHGFLANYESDKAAVEGLVVSQLSNHFDHWKAESGLDQWCKNEKIPGLASIDTRALTKKLRDKGSMLGKILVNGQEVDFYDPNTENLIKKVSIKVPSELNPGKEKRVVVIDCGCKNSILKSLIQRDVSILQVPWNYDLSNEKFDGLLISNGPGNPKMYPETIEIVAKAMERDIPILGICLGNQILALASGADTYKLKFGHRSQNQPCVEVGTKRCYITSQNHGYAIDPDTLGSDWKPWFFNLNDGSNEGIRHISKPFFSIQFHPEASPGPTDTNFIFDDFTGLL